MTRTTANGDGVADAVLDAVREDPALTPAEKETVVRFGKPDDEAVVHTREGALTRRLIAHPESTLVYLNAVDEDGVADAIEPAEWNGQQVTGVEARLPVGALKVQLSARTSTQHAEIVSDHVLNGGER
jgi:hypothetical protein